MRPCWCSRLAAKRSRRWGRRIARLVAVLHPLADVVRHVVQPKLVGELAAYELRPVAAVLVVPCDRGPVSAPRETVPGRPAGRRARHIPTQFGRQLPPAAFSAAMNAGSSSQLTVSTGRSRHRRALGFSPISHDRQPQFVGHLEGDISKLAAST